MQIAIYGQANILSLPVVAKSSGNPITSGTVNFYLKDRDGANAGKWYRGSDQSWQAAESIAGQASHDGDGHWYLSLPSAVWVDDVRYKLYAKESGNLHIPVGEDVICSNKDEEIEFIKNVAEGDIEIDTDATPWQVVLKIKGTDTVLIRKDLKDKDGNNITTVNALIGKYLEPS